MNKCSCDAKCLKVTIEDAIDNILPILMGPLERHLEHFDPGDKQKPLFKLAVKCDSFIEGGNVWDNRYEHIDSVFNNPGKIMPPSFLSRPEDVEMVLVLNKWKDCTGTIRIIFIKVGEEDEQRLRQAKMR